MTQFKGPRFPSYRDALPSQTQRMQYVSHQNVRRQVRNLRQWTRPITESHDAEALVAGRRVIRAALEEPEPEFVTLHLFYAGMKMSDETKQPWPVCMNYLMDRFDERKAADVESQNLTEDRQAIAVVAAPKVIAKSVAFVGRLFRGAFTRERLQATEEDTVTDEHQRTCTRDAQSTRRSDLTSHD